MQVLRVKLPEKFILFVYLEKELNWWIPTEKIIFATRKPKECVIEDGKLVKLVYQDGYAIT
jgi:hypothetical protein